MAEGGATVDKTVRIFAPVDRETHRSLTEMANNRRIPLYQLVEAIFVWAGEKDVQSLIRLGVNLPVYANELESSSTEGSK